MKNVKTEYKKSGMMFFIERLRRCVSWNEKRPIKKENKDDYIWKMG